MNAFGSYLYGSSSRILANKNRRTTVVYASAVDTNNTDVDEV